MCMPLIPDEDEIKESRKSTNQTENYIILKPLSEKFNRIAAEITDDEIKNLIKSEIRQQISRCDFSSVIKEVYDDWLEDSGEFLVDTFQDFIKNKFR